MTSAAPAALARTRPFQASRLATISRCALRYLFETELPALSLPETLPTILGRAAHRLLETASTRSTRAEEVRSLLLDMTLADLAASTARVPQWAVRHGLLQHKGVVPTETLASRVRFVVSRLMEARERGKRDGRFGKRHFGPEVRLEASEFDLVGVADRVDLEAPRRTAVAEFKTGALRVEPGDAHRVQLLAYGLMVARRDGHAVALRALSPVGEWNLEFDRRAEEEIVRTLEAANACLPRGVLVDAEAVAAPGSVCLGCRHRPICAAYSQWAPQTWRDGVGGRPLDVWGAVVRITARDDLLDLLVLDDAGTAVRVAGVALTGVERLPMEGIRIHLFDLASAENLRVIRRPLNYLAADRSNVRGSAWSATIEW